MLVAAVSGPRSLGPALGLSGCRHLPGASPACDGPRTLLRSKYFTSEIDNQCTTVFCTLLNCSAHRAQLAAPPDADKTRLRLPTGISTCTMSNRVVRGLPLSSSQAASAAIGPRGFAKMLRNTLRDSCPRQALAIFLAAMVASASASRLQVEGGDRSAKVQWLLCLQAARAPRPPSLAPCRGTGADSGNHDPGPALPTTPPGGSLRQLR